MTVPGTSGNPFYVQFGGQSFSTTLTTSTDTALSIKVSGDAVDRLNVLASGKLTWGDGTNAGDTTLYRSAADTLKTDDSLIVAGTALSHTGTTVGFYGATPAARATGYTQTYSTATRTHSNPTASAVVTTAATQTTPFGFASGAQADAISVAINALIVDVANVKGVVNSVVDDLQTIGISH